MPTEATFTAEFIEDIDALFDIFNIKSMTHTKPFCRALTNISQHWENLNKCRDIFDKIKILKCKVSLPCIAGWRINISALDGIWEMLQLDYGFDFLLTNRLNQNALENLFSII